MKRLLFILLFLLPLMGATAQEQLIREGSFKRRQAEITGLPENPERINALERARELNIPDRRLYPDGRMVAFRRFNPNGKPEYLSTFNLNAARTLSTSRVWKNGGSGLDLTGEGLVVGVWDGGILRSTHREFEDRARVMNTAASSIDHATHVSGTIGALGFDEDARGMASRVIIEGYDWFNDIDEMDAAASSGLLLSNNSYGFIVGFNYNSDEERWEWWGDTRISEEEDYMFGYYHQEARSYDEIAYNNPDFLISKSAGNDRGEGPPPGIPHYVWDNGDWVSSNVVRQMDGGPDGYGCIGPVSSAKNIMVVGAVNDAEFVDGIAQNPQNAVITSYSSFGPTDDGRIKPDVVGNGQRLYSSGSDSDDDYYTSSGTSMSTPNVSGSLSLLQEHYHNLYEAYMNAASLKGLVIHTADDAGNAGPDYSFGWGQMNTLNAALLINKADSGSIHEQVLENDQEIRMTFYTDGTEPLRVTICWTDPAGEVPEISLNPGDRILVNDLDLRITRLVDGKMYRPFVLDPLHPSLPATTGDNQLDNVEQVYVDQPDKGYYDIVVRHKEELVNGAQPFSMIVSGLSGDYYASGNNQLSDNNGSFFLTSASEYLPGMEVSWLITPENGLPISMNFSLFETEEGMDWLRIYDGEDNTAPLLAEFSGFLPDADTILQSSTASLWVSFGSNGQNQGRGFRASYCTVAPEGDFMISGEVYPCVDSLATYLVSGQEGTSYLWSVPEGWTEQESGGNFIRLTPGSGQGLIAVEPFNLCGQSLETGIQLEPFSGLSSLQGFEGDTILCRGTMERLTVDNLQGVTYQWVLPENWQGSSETHILDYVPSAESGAVFVSTINSCGAGEPLNIPLVVQTIPEEPEIYSLSDTICQYSSTLFYVQGREGNEYLWTVEEDWTIIGENNSDTIQVQVGSDGAWIYLNASNACGSQDARRFSEALALPETPLLRESSSIYEELRILEVQNATNYTHIQWYLNNEIIDSPLATGPSYVAYNPGLYSVGVSGRNGCSLVQDQGEGIGIGAPDKVFSVHAGSHGSLVVRNSSKAQAILNVYNLEGKLQIVREVGPGYTEIPTILHGVQLVSVSGSGNYQSFRIFLR